MRKKTAFAVVLAISIISAAAAGFAAPDSGQTYSGQWTKRGWDAKFCWHPDGPGHDPALMLFRNTLTLAAKPDKFIIHISADQRYRLYVNGVSAAAGPARGDLLHWRFETVDIAPLLKEGKNVIAARAWSLGVMAPWAQVSSHNAFIVQGEGDAEAALNTPGSWKVYHDESWTPMPKPGSWPVSQVTGANERIDAALHPWGWMSPGFDDSSWKTPAPVADGVPSGMWGDGSSMWKLVPRPIPLMQETPQRIPKVARAKKVEVPAGFLEGKAPLTIPANTKATILLDNVLLTNAYPELTVSGGRGSKIRLSYEESLFKYPEVRFWNLIKGNRNDFKKCEIRPDYKFDEFFPDGGAGRMFSPLWWRTFRFLQIDVETADDPVTLDDVYPVFTGYPFQARASFDSSDPELKTIWETGWRTARLCAGETYFDCPYYEQLQYAGDTRVQTMISMYVSGDDRLVRNAIETLADSRMTEGITQSRYPSRMTQVIPTFALAWIGIVHDHWLMRRDDAFTARFLPAMGEALGWFGSHRLGNGLLGDLNWWEFVDWSWPGGVPPGANDSRGSCIVTLQYALALRETARIEEALGRKAEAATRRAQADAAVTAVQKQCWSAERGMMADTPQKDAWSQHATVLGVLADAIPKDKQKQALQRAADDKTIAQCTLYFRYFLHRALEKAGLADNYLAMLAPWREMLSLGLTTWPETPGEARSDCHAWSAGPTADLLSMVCGVKPAEPGFVSVLVEPHLNGLEWVTCEVPHPRGMIKVSLHSQPGGKVSASVELPPGVTGKLKLAGRETKLNAGMNESK